MMLKRSLIIGLLLALAAVVARATTPPPPPPTTAPRIPVLTPLPAQRAVPTYAPGLETCGAPAGFAPYLVQMGDTLVALVDPASGWNAPTVAALNCLDDTDSLPVGALIFLPQFPVPTRTPCLYERLGVYTSGTARLPCPDAPPRSQLVVWQPFERGLMLWFADARLIYALVDDGTGALFADTYADEPQPPLTPPPGLFVPQRGFRVIWESLGAAESPLGWALAAETGFDALTQAAGRSSFTTYIQLPGRLLAVTAHPDLDGALWWAALEA